jgi:diadenylate cyclase
VAGRRLAPGTVLREGIERIIRAGRGALIVIGWTPEVEPLVSGGFVIDIGATSQRIAELAKMDGALVLDARPNASCAPTSTSSPTPRSRPRDRDPPPLGGAHRPPDRHAGHRRVRVDGDGHLYHGDRKHVVEEVSALLFRANQALSTLERYRSRLDEVSATLSAREVEDAVTVRDAVLTLQRAEMLRRIAPRSRTTSSSSAPRVA